MIERNHGRGPVGANDSLPGRAKTRRCRCGPRTFRASVIVYAKFAHAACGHFEFTARPIPVPQPHRSAAERSTRMRGPTLANGACAWSPARGTKNCGSHAAQKKKPHGRKTKVRGGGSGKLAWLYDLPSDLLSF